MASLARALVLLLAACAAVGVLGATSNSTQLDEEVVLRLRARGGSALQVSALPEDVLLDRVHADGSATVYLTRADSLRRLREAGEFEIEVLHNEAPEMARATRAACEEQRARASPRQAYEFTFSRYHDYNELVRFLQEINARYPDITRLYSPGRATLQGRRLWVLEMSDNINTDENEAGEMELHYVANIHGDETVGRELSLRFIHYLVTTYYDTSSADHARVRSLIDDNTIAVMPSMNPDGFELGRRTNSRAVDLNRNFPDQFRGTPSETQIEVEAIRQWLAGRHFSSSISFHGGAIVANYPYDSNRQGVSGIVSPTPDHETMLWLASTYASTNSDMLNSREFPGGIINGAEWYVLYGGMQDYNYLWEDCIQLTIELSNIKYPSATTLQSYWERNKESMLRYLEVSTLGIRGAVLLNGEPCPDAEVRLVDNTHVTTTDRVTGDFYRVLKPSPIAYTYSVHCNGQVQVGSTKVGNTPTEFVVYNF